ncbi:MerR family transcriptional regulator [Nonomuraea soli]|uniref:DNA-binding transcriptional MerR regulator n=1 Tax=Nonomuraea soli TaxID=1032476 RepID=A0A7W0HMH9_9ACTN|nr:MerR family transcriptional regulator [Nonomuraea soli]MBA2888760.1 DNA-binding transcriptional MerR regulator [Nonomuraea soli]
MRMSELSSRSGLAIATIKYYLREGLLPQGRPLAATRADYDESHLRRLRLIRALLEVGRLPIASIKQIISAVDDDSLPTHVMLGVARHALSAAVAPEPGDDWSEAEHDAERLIAAQGWRIGRRAPARAELVQTLHRLRQLELSTDLGHHAELAHRLVTEIEIPSVTPDGPRDSTVESVVLGTVLYGKAFDALRRLAREAAEAEVSLSTAPDA